MRRNSVSGAGASGCRHGSTGARLEHGRSDQHTGPGHGERPVRDVKTRRTAAARNDGRSAGVRIPAGSAASVLTPERKGGRPWTTPRPSFARGARRADNDGNCERASAIRESLVEIDRHAAADLQSLKMRYGPAPPSPTRAPLQMPATDAPRFDWCMAFQQLTSIRLYFQQAGQPGDAENFRKVIARLETQVRYRFKNICGSGAKPPPRRCGLPPNRNRGTAPSRICSIKPKQQVAAKGRPIFAGQCRTSTAAQ